MNDDDYWGIVSLVRATGRATDVGDLCRLLVLDTLVKFGAIGAVYFSATSDGLVRPVTSYGCPIEQMPAVSLATLPQAPQARVMNHKEPLVLSPEESICRHPLIPGTEQENLLVPALDRDVAIGTLVLIIKTTSILKHDEVMPRASRLIQEALSSIVQKSNFNAVSTQRENRDFNPELLSPRQKEILALVAKELTSLQIARSLNVSESLVKKELVTMYKALGTLNRSETILRYRQYQSTPWGEVHLAPPPIFEANGVR